MSDDVEDIGPIDDAPEVVDAPPAEDDAAFEEQALKLGWKPRDQFTLSTARWRSAREYVESPQGQVRILRGELADRDKRIEATEMMAKSANDLIRRQERQRYERELESVRAAKEEAVEAADKEKYQQLDKYETELRAAPQQPQVPDEVVAYRALPEAKWMDDPILVDFAKNAINTTPGIISMAAGEQVRWAAEKVKEYFPHKFAPKPEQPRDESSGRYTTSRVDGGGLAGGNRTIGLDADEREAFKVLKAKGVFKNEAEYIAHARSLGVRE